MNVETELRKFGIFKSSERAVNTITLNSLVALSYR